jgi:MFS transporter, DHA1 family, multidrug resistance protein
MSSANATAAASSSLSVDEEPQDYSGWQRNLLFVWIGVFVGLMGASFVFPFVPFYIQSLGVEDKSQVAYYTGITASATGLSLTLTAPIWGSMADKFGRKPMFLRALIGAGLVICLMGLVQAVWQLVLLRFLMGAFAGTMGAAAALVAASTPREKTGQSLGLLQTAAFSSSMIGPFVGGVVASSLGIRNSFFFCSALYLIAAVLAYIFVRERKGPVVALGSKRPASSGSIVQNLRTVMSEKQVLLMLGLLFCLNLSNTFVRPVQPLSIDGFADHLGIGDRVPLHLLFINASMKEELATGVLFGVIGGTSTIAALCVSPVAQRIGYRNAVTGAALFAGALYIPLAFVGSYTTFLLAFGAVGLFQGAMVPGTNALLAANAPDGKHGSVFGLAASMQSMALLIGPLSGGFVSGTFGNSAVYVIIGTLLVCAAIAARLYIREPAAFVPAPVRRH